MPSRSAISKNVALDALQYEDSRRLGLKTSFRFLCSTSVTAAAYLSVEGNVRATLASSASPRWRSIAVGGAMEVAGEIERRSTGRPPPCRHYVRTYISGAEGVLNPDLRRRRGVVSPATQQATSFRITSLGSLTPSHNSCWESPGMPFAACPRLGQPRMRAQRRACCLARLMEQPSRRLLYWAAAKCSPVLS